MRCHTTAPAAANPSWPRARSLFLQHHHAQQAGYLQRFTILRWCSGSPAERVRFPGPGDKARNGRNETTFPDLKFFLLPCRLSPCWMPVFAEKKCLITNTHTLSGQRSQPPILGRRPHRKTQCTCEPARWLCDESHEGGRPNGPASLSPAQRPPQIT